MYVARGRDSVCGWMDAYRLTSAIGRLFGKRCIWFSLQSFELGDRRDGCRQADQACGLTEK